MDFSLKKLGYRINYVTLRREYQEAANEELSHETQNWYDAVALYIVLAYQVGRKGKELTVYFHFLEAIA